MAITPRLRYLSVNLIWATLPILGMLWISWNNRIMVLDFWWHLKAGQIIDQTHQIPSVDLFSYTAAGKPFILQNWLAEWLLYRAYAAGSLPLAIVLGGLLMAAGCALLLALCRWLTGNLRLAVLVTLAAEAMVLRSANLRPQVFSWPLFVLAYGLLWLYYRRGTRAVWLLPPLMALWVNLHGAFVLALILMALMLSATAWNAWRGRIPRSPWEPLAVMVTSVLATLLNPAGARLYQYIATVLSDPVSQRLVSEWQPAAPSNWQNLPFFVLLSTGLLLLLYSPRRPNLLEVTLFAAFGALGMFSIRNIMWFGVVAAPILGLQVAPMLEPPAQPDDAHPGAAQLAKAIMRNVMTPGSEGKSVINLALLLVLLGVTMLFTPWARMYLWGPDGELALLDPRTPVDAVRFIEEHNLQGHIFHPQIYGDYMIWKLYPRHKVFVDGRVHLYGPEIWSDYLLMIRGADWEKLAEQYAIQYVMLNRVDKVQHRLEEVLQESLRWYVIYSDTRSAIYAIRNE
jgi:hypothetical protein